MDGWEGFGPGEPEGEEIWTPEERTEGVIKEMAAACLNKMLTSNFFSICAVTDVVDMYQAKRYREAREFAMLHSQHCVDFKEMTEAVRNGIPELIHNALLPFVDLHLSDKVARNGVRLFQTAYLPESKRKQAEAQTAKPWWKFWS